ncbi:hypothetical protein [Haloarcula sp. K1]|uniref:hypothetical protein n=1 Tax=Haloarcula sp. K1 TaxID=1622207 RepID=UPI001E5B2010|nr:hypothetical protein [Haloarcula sp. K1]
MTLDRDDAPSTSEDIDTTVDSLSLRLGERQLEFNIGDESGKNNIPDSYLDISTAASNLATESSDRPESEREPFKADYIELLSALVVEFDPLYLAVINTTQVTTGPPPKTCHPSGVPVELERLPWLGVYSEPLIEQFGGRQRVLDTPAWMVEELENGSILIVTTRIPWEDYGSKHPADRYLLDGMDRADAVSPPSDVTLSDPFASFDPGAIGTDICVHQDDIAPEFANEDLQLIPVHVDEHRNLRHLDTNAFVRNVVTNTTGDKAAIVKRMLSDVPATSDDDLYVSALLRDVIPPAFVRLDDPDNENVVTKVMRLETDVNKIKLLVSLSRVAQQDDFTTEDLNSMEGALDTLNELDDNENIDQYIEAKLL